MSDAPTLRLPLLLRGRHRNPRKGACFMEYASYLAGCPWSDHPDCTHPLLALVAREVNDETSDEGRSGLAPLIPSVIGVTTDDLRLPPALVVRCVRPVLPVVSPQYQRVLAVALLAAEQTLADLEGRSPAEVRTPSADALDAVPGARSWAEAFLVRHPEYRAPDRVIHSAQRAIAGAVRAISDFRVPKADVLLRQILIEAIDECRSFMPPVGDHVVVRGGQVGGWDSMSASRASARIVVREPGGHA